ncbi:hypothetical protein BBJ28_00001452 [Nothophytophthora sp. Chile5]|nr:hypothetical protein BBJ28_00001452 [Nothophytophthora sp. Chile5]
MLFDGTPGWLTAALGFSGLSNVHAHGYLSFTAAVYRDSYTATSFTTTITASVNPTAFQGKKWNDSPERNAAMFTAAFQDSSYSSLREMVEPFVLGCGNTRLDVPSVDVAGATEARWQNDQERKGFVDSHHGPCEIWVDDQRALHDDDCRARFTTYPAHLPVDYDTLCSGECRLTYYWLALHEPAWQVYSQYLPS